jgi:hypothetical protein
MKATFKLTRDIRSLAGQFSTRSAADDGRNAIERFREVANGMARVSEPFDATAESVSVTLEAIDPARDLPKLAEEWQRCLLASGMQADVVA